MSNYESATICLNGHVASSSAANYRKFCKKCGEPTISNCKNCRHPIQGNYYNPNFPVISKYEKPLYCHNCGKPYPWIQTIIDNAIDLLYLDDEIDSETKEIIKNAIPDLIVDKPSTPLAAAKYKKLVPKTADFVQSGLKNIFIDIVSESVKKTIWPS